VILIIDPNSPIRDNFSAVRTELWFVWAEVAEEHEATALRAREEVRASISSAGRAFGPLEIEVKASMVAVSAAAHALDAFATAAREAGVIDDAVIEGWRAHRTPRAGQIHETICRTFNVRSWSRRWAKELQWLFRLRGETVHFQSDWAALERHSLGFDTSPVAATYTVEASSRAVDLLLEIVATTTGRPKKNPDVVKWCQTWSHAGPELDDLRATLRAVDRSTKPLVPQGGE
jgi:hypothetical protein